MWGVLRWPEIVARMGGLPWLAPFHTLIAWLFAAFLVLHIYLTTTGHTPTANLKAMTIGWDEVEVGDGRTVTIRRTGRRLRRLQHRQKPAANGEKSPGDFTGDSSVGKTDSSQRLRALLSC